MSAYTLTATVDRPFGETVEAARAALGEQGFGVLTEIDISKTLQAKLGVEVEQQVILGACAPELAYDALRADPSIAAVLPCNVVVRALDASSTLVEMMDPDAMMGLSGAQGLQPVADAAKQRLGAALQTLSAQEA